MAGNQTKTDIRETRIKQYAEQIASCDSRAETVINKVQKEWKLPAFPVLTLRRSTPLVSSWWTRFIAALKRLLRGGKR